MESAELAVLEALADPRIAGPERSLPAAELEAELARQLPGASWRGLVEEGLADVWGENVQLVVDGSAALEAARAGREIEWATRSLTQGEALGAFASYCREELDDVEVLEESPARLALGWKRERTTIELRAGFLFCERLGHEAPALLLAELGDAAVERFLADEGLRSRVAVYDLARLEKVNAVRASAFVYFEWFLRDAYGVKVLPAPAFTQGLVDRGIISLGMG